MKNPEKIDFELVNPTKKIVHIKSATTPFFLAMSESYHPQWQLEMNNDKINGFWNSWIPFVTPDKISDDNHLKLNDFLNAWFVEPERLCELSSYKVESYKVEDKTTHPASTEAPLSRGELSGDKIPLAPFAKGGNNGCTKNSDGSYDLEMVVEFYPQRYFYLGLLISGTTLLGSISYLAYDFLRRRRKNIS